MTDRESARAAKQHLRVRLADLIGVGGIGIGRRDGGYVVTVDVVEEAVCERVPRSWEGVDVEVRVVGRVRALGDVATGAGGTDVDGTGAAGGPGGGPVPGWRLVGPDGPGTGR